MTTSKANPDCPSWCDDLYVDCGGNPHQEVIGYVPASRSFYGGAGPAGGIMPALGVIVSQRPHDGTSVVVHCALTATSEGCDEPSEHIDRQFEMSVEEAMEHAANLLHALTSALEGQPSTSSGFARRILTEAEQIANVHRTEQGEWA